ncbi:copper resistance CopC family protein [Leisingera sp. ANG59]|uniref:copper resistance CopC family protein n=1 Tax=Leisingera sp. ANG59 TaxID=2675221 RepID=UPI0015726860|nr:copper resistance CopC family protein [Leisingera sp. ANG59]NSY38964.1 copper resistance protein CopC [Leisingera sp. ANG59]
MKKLAVAAFAAALATGSAAHSPVESTTPANGAAVTEVPAEISLSFANDIRLTRVEMAHQDHGPVPLDLDGPARFDRTFVLPLQGMGAGTYRIEWRGLGADGHAMRGEFSFQVE